MQEENIEENFEIIPDGGGWLSLQEFIYPFATVLLFMGPAIFPEPPRILYGLAMRSPVFQWMLVYILVWQGGAQRDALVSFYITLSAFIVTQILNAVFPIAL